MSEFDVILYGATGYTGRLIADYLAKSHGAARWALAGRDAGKLARLRDEIGAPDAPTVIAEAHDEAALRAMCARAKVILSAVGPYQLNGSALVAACVDAGTGYVDLCGEPGWMRSMIDAHEATARRTGARIVFSCGFDSVPFDLGVFTAQAVARKKYGHAAPRVKGRVRVVKGGISGGTAASVKATLAAVAREPSLGLILGNPFALTPGFAGPHQPSGMLPEYDGTIGAWVAPFVMAPVNTKNIHRTNYLLGHAYGRDFVYDEMQVTGLGDMGKAAAEALARFNPFATRAPKPGEGPTAEEREAGYYDLLFIALMPEGGCVECVVTGDRDPGYGSTSKIAAEAALCLAQDIDSKGGIWTPAALLGDKLRDRLTAHAGLSFRTA